MTREQAEKLHSLQRQGYRIKFNGGGYINTFGRITKEGDALMYEDDTYSPMNLQTVSPERFGVYREKVGWWE